MKKIKLLNVLALTGILSLGAFAFTSCDNKTTEETQNLITIEGSKDTLNLGDTLTLTAKNSAGETLEVTWRSSNSPVAVVDSKLGTVTPIKVGSTVISAELNGYETASFSLTVVDPSITQSITLTAENNVTTLKVNEKVQLTAKDDKGVTLNNVTFSSNNSSVAMVTNTGVVTGLGEGKARISAELDGYNPGYIDITVEGGEVAPATYKINYITATSVTFEGPDSATVGSTVTFTAKVKDINLVSIKEITMNDTPLTSTGNNQYSFTMPDRDVTIRAKLTWQTTDSEVVLTGDDYIPLVKNTETGLYEAKGIQLNEDSSFAYWTTLLGDTDEPTQLTYQDLDFYKCFASIETSRDDETSFELPGGFTYDFYYDPSAELRPAYIKRVAVDTLPNSTTTLENLFDHGKSSETTYPENVKKVTYENSLTQEHYEFTRYQDNKSYATVTNLQGVQQAIVYKSLEDDNYQFVDTYIEGRNDPTKKDDTEAKSANIKVFDTQAAADASNWKNFPANSGGVETSLREATFDANHYSHDMNSIEFDIMYAYRFGFASDYLQSSNIDISTKANADSTFTTTIDSYKTLVDASSNLYEHYEYDVELSFTSDGSLLGGTYKEKVYNQNDYNFDSGKEGFLPGGENRGTLVKTLEFSYEYSETLDQMPSMDMSQYFISDISKVTINNDSFNSDDTKNILKKGDIIEKGDNFDIDYSPTTALDAWQYEIIKSTNEDVIGRGNYSSWQYRALKNGTSTLTVGNQTTNEHTMDIDVTVDSTPVRSVYFDTVNGNKDDLVETEESGADYVYVYDSKKSYVTLKASPHGADNTSLVFTSSNENVKFNYDPDTELLEIDATNYHVTDDSERVTLTITSDNWDPDTSSKGDELYIYFVKGYALTEEDMYGTWKIQGEQDQIVEYVHTDLQSHTAQFNEETEEVQIDSDTTETYHTGTLTTSAGSKGFYWRIVNGRIEGRVLEENQLTDRISFLYDPKTSRLGILYEIGSWDAEEGSEAVVTKTYFMGETDGDEDYPTDLYEYFGKAN